MKVIIISGSACSGKTTLVNQLDQFGYHVVKETAATIIQRRKLEGRTLPWDYSTKDSFRWLGFEKEIYDFHVENYMNLSYNENSKIVLDRSTEDILAYIGLNSLETPRWWLPTHTLLGLDTKIPTLILNPIPYLSNGIRNDNAKESQYREFEKLIEIHAFYNEVHYENNSYLDMNPKSLEDRVKLVERIMGD